MIFNTANLFSEKPVKQVKDVMKYNNLKIDEQPKGDVSRLESNFMGGNQVETFKSLTSPESVDRSGRAISSVELDPVGIEPAINPPFATPIDVDKKGINSLYNKF